VELLHIFRYYFKIDQQLKIVTHVIENYTIKISYLLAIFVKTHTLLTIVTKLIQPNELIKNLKNYWMLKLFNYIHYRNALYGI